MELVQMTYDELMLDLLNPERIAGDDDQVLHEMHLGASMVLMEAFDKKVTREQFAELVQNAVGLVDASTCLGMLLLVQGYQGRPEGLTKEVVASSLEVFRGLAKPRAAKCVEIGKLLQECRSKKDALN